MPYISDVSSIRSRICLPIWLFVNGDECFLSFQDYPYFKDHTLIANQTVELLHGYHLYWPALDVDLEIDNLENPEKYLLKSKPIKPRPSHATSSGELH